MGQQAAPLFGRERNISAGHERRRKRRRREEEKRKRKREEEEKKRRGRKVTGMYIVLHFFFIRDSFFELSLGVLKFLSVFSLKFS